MGIHNESTKLQQYTQELWNDYTNDEDIVIRKSNNNLSEKSKKTKKMALPPTPKKKAQPIQPVKDSKELKEIKDFLEENLAVGFGSLVPSTNKKRVRNRKPKAKKQNGQPINLQNELNKYDDGWETMLYKKNKKELNHMKREVEKEEKIQKAQMLNKGFVRHNRTASATESEVKSPIKQSKQSKKDMKIIKEQLDQQIELQKQKQQKKNEMEKWNQKLQNEKKKQSQPLKGTRGKESKFNSIIQEQQQLKEKIKSDNSKPKANKTKPQSPEEDVQKIIQKQVEHEKQQKQQELLKAQKEKKQQKLMKQQKHAQMVERANNKSKATNQKK
ncbi:hypothetical protein BCR36DRAFT_583870 [Piromyces finnis]|uniref:Uncharacterized protein n=1 Tax=Piromyces finnis TaxID=1754191 RepID=A0A1Y1V9K4_9FUNG|nr:hypothetical protein BCR36DRAFT_583870 [Piromyces finnis]|eukprot:ORX49272.1 hypothetical protein BCR36DRAFT_583870 [Piromyces finnis]